MKKEKNSYLSVVDGEKEARVIENTSEHPDSATFGGTQEAEES